ncbi:MAG: Polysaccharide biosynthesis protein [Proteobacteria bacterium]|nr:Polysaccharide biosynthesis protein [Pseudomonadota bacterium]
MECKFISIVLPQFHPFAENDRWWGKGFTEWTNVAKARPLFTGHNQPQLPADLGFYDLRLPQARAGQAELAAQYGIDGFCYYHYWFKGKRLLNYPIEENLKSGQPDFPFCLCWANESWTRAWDGESRELLVEQGYSDDDDLAHIRHLLPFFADRRYIRVDSRPLFVVYRADDLPNPRKTFDLWRNEALKSGVGELCLARFERGGGGGHKDPRDDGLDLSIEFAPDWRNLGGRYYATAKARLAARLGIIPKAYLEHNIFDYRRMVEKVMAKSPPDYPFVRCVSPGFDNSSRRAADATIIINGSPDAYQDWLSRSAEWSLAHNRPEHRLVFINAWNEWAEGNHLEPCAKFGRAYLEATQTVRQRFSA